MTRLMIAVCMVAIWNATLLAYSGGSGTTHDPYQIATAEDLIALGNEPNDYNDCFVLTADIDLSGYVFDRAVIAPTSQYFDARRHKTGFNGTAFSGEFNGQGYEIWNVHIHGDEVLGLFGRLEEDALISNLGIEAIDVNASGNYSGGLVGRNKGTIRSCYCKGDVSGNGYVGGLVGMNYGGSITDCFSAGIVGGCYYDTGGLVGWNCIGVISSSYCLVNVSGSMCVGGLVGTNDDGRIISSYSTGSVYGYYGGVGGLVGYNHNGAILSSYCTGDVNGSEGDIGGLVGCNNGSIATSYSIGLVRGGDYVGGLVGSNLSGIIASCFWDIETSGQSNSDGGKGLSSCEMQNIATSLEAGWDFVGETANGTCNYWLEHEDGYPSLSVFSGVFPVEPNGSGTLDDPFIVMDANDLGTVWTHPYACYRLESDIDLAGITWDLAPVPWFNGLFDGNGHLIRNLWIEGDGYLGLFGQCGARSIISDLGLEAVDVNGVGDFVGGLVGHNSGVIKTSYCTGSVSGYNSVGGLVGVNSDGSVTSCYSIGWVYGEDYVGGLVGRNYNGTVTSSFWDTETSGQTDSDGGIGLPTAQMQDINTYLEAGWDFVDETVNGTEDIWWMPENDYPRLWWEE